ncbi:MAG TPA: hypothetical protein VEJ18_08265 [Planctomycetota bacterium]|nr:hypothetical protein [Planctomycetota bacterium]
MKSGETSLGGAARSFPETVWEVVGPSARTGERLDALVRAYWKPVYGYVRAVWRRSNEDGKDLVQAFFAWLLESGALAKYDPARGRFRPFLKSLLRHFVQHQDEALGRLKRGGGVALLPLDDGLARLDAQLADPRYQDPESAFDRAWRTSLLDAAQAAVRDRLMAAGKEAAWKAFEAYDLADAEGRPTYRALAERMNLKEKDVENHLVFVREALRTEIREALLRTSARREDLDDEWTEFLRS